MREKLEAERSKKTGNNLNKGLSGLFKRSATLVLENEAENSELMRRLRGWKLKKKEYENELHRKRIAETNISLNEDSIKMMIIKLNQIENLMKDLNRKTKMVKGSVAKRGGRAGESASSRRSNIGAAFGARDRQNSVLS